MGRVKGSVNKRGLCAIHSEKILEMVRSGCRIGQIEKETGAGQTTIKRYLKHLGVEFDSSGKSHSVCAKNHELLLKMNSEGVSLTQMAKAIGSKGTSVKKYLRSVGVIREFLVSGYSKEKSPHWKGGTHIDKDGYRLVYCPDHPHGRKHTPYILEHRLVMEKMIGRYLLPEEVVHHRDKNKLNNSPENLQLFSDNSTHLATELAGQCPKWTETGLDRIQKLIDRNAAKRRGQIRVPLTPDEKQLKRKSYRFVAPQETTLLDPSEKEQ